ncbi:MAG: hypothetical protein M1818_003331 [Claussenomyces sp. TS43310]|nr:MAG: hypothetical protein M1818_003331 [Claussenomyces sp. TS43310]
MSSATRLEGLASPTGKLETEQNTTHLPTQEKAQSYFELGISLSLCLWPALTLAVQNHWGGPDSADKRDWFSGAVVSLFDERPDTDLEDVETVLLQVMQDEFEVAVDDESAFEVAEQIVRLRRDCGRGNFGEVEALQSRWNRKAGHAGDVFQKVERDEAEDDTDYDSDDLDVTDDEDEDKDIEMSDAPAPKEKPAPQIDEDGFTKVVSKKKR